MWQVWSYDIINPNMKLKWRLRFEILSTAAGSNCWHLWCNLNLNSVKVDDIWLAVHPGHGNFFIKPLKTCSFASSFFNVCFASAWQNRRNSVCICSGRPEWASKYVQSTACRSRHRRSVAVLNHQPLTHLWSSTVKERIGRWGPTNAPRH